MERYSREELVALFEEKGIHKTLQRIEMAYILLNKNQHLSAEDVNQLINHSFPKASRATIFNNLKVFVDSGLIKKLEILPGVTTYDTNTSEHHHFLDLETGRIEDIEPSDRKQEKALRLAQKLLRKSIQPNIAAEDIQIIIRGKKLQDC